MAEHGTYAMYQRHRKAGEEACEPCRLACRRYMKGYRRRAMNQPLADALIVEGYSDGYADGLRAARNAVANLPVALIVIRDGAQWTRVDGVSEDPEDYPHGVVQVAAMFAIDSLREETNAPK